MNVPITQTYEPAVPVADLREHPDNPRRGDTEAIASSMAAHGFYGAIYAQRSTGVIVAGNHRHRVAVARGEETVPVIWLDVDDDEARRILLVDNRTGDLGGYDDEALRSVLQELHEFTDLGLVGSGYTIEDIHDLFGEPEREPWLTDPDALPDPPTPHSETGDLWLLGDHRLLCGSSIDPDDVARLLAGAAPTLLVTDPPYGVELDMEWRDRAGHNEMAPAERSYMKQAMGGQGISGDTIGDWSAAFELVPSLRIAYVWHATSHMIEVATGLERLGFQLRQQIIWAKTVAAMSRSAYHWKHEPCWYAVMKGATAEWIGGDDQTTVWEAASPKHIMSGSKEEKLDHPTQKPMECMERPIRNHQGDVYEPFGGSGTTLIAAEHQGRRSYVMEVEPRYVDIICRRFQEHTGIAPILEATGEAHDFTEPAEQVA